MEDGKEAGSKPAGEPKRRAAKAPGSASRQRGKTVRVQLHLDEMTVKRLGVHCALVSRNQSAEAGRILLSYLLQHGRGQEIFDKPDFDPDAL